MTGDKVHQSHPKSYGDAYRTGDVIGVFVHLPINEKKLQQDLAAKNLSNQFSIFGCKKNVKAKKFAPQNVDGEIVNVRSLPPIITHRRTRIPIKFKGTLFFESKDVPHPAIIKQIKKYETLLSKLSTSLSNAPNNITDSVSISSDKNHTESEPHSNEALIENSFLQFFKNGWSTDFSNTLYFWRILTFFIFLRSKFF